MTALDLQPGKAVFILWEDSATIDGWHRDPEPDVGRISTVGWVINGDTTSVVVSTSLNDQFSCICPLSIPWSCISEVHELSGLKWNKPYAPPVAEEVSDFAARISGVLSSIKKEDRELTEQYEKICQELQKS